MTDADQLPRAWELRPYQVEAIDAIAAGLAGGGRGQLHAACGSGKTVMGLRAADRLVPGPGTIVVLAPSLALVAQTLAEWRAATRVDAALAVCSDDSVADAPVHVDDIDTEVTTDPEHVRKWLDGNRGVRALIVGTYRSADRLAEALRSAESAADLVICDEAHHLTGRQELVTRRVLDEAFLPARRRLFMTATPRMEDRGDKDIDGEGVLSMSDEDIFGQVLYSYPFARAIHEGYLSDYRLLVIGISDQEARALLADDSREYVDRIGGQELRMIAAQAALARAQEQRGLRRIITYHPRVAQSAEFARTLNSTISRLSEAGRPRGPLESLHIHSGMDSRQRQAVLKTLAQPARGGWTVVSNCHILSEGVDVPAVDCVMFAAPKRSSVQIIQGIGRALRQSPDTEGPATIVVPLVVPDEGGEIGDLDAGRYDVLWEVVRALRAHDEPLGLALDMQRSHGQASGPELPEKITVELPQGTTEQVLADLKVLLVRQTTSVWWEGYGYARAYYQRHGDLAVQADYKTEDGFRLGAWITSRRHHRRKGWISADRIRLLDDIGMIWDPYDTAWQLGLRAARAFREEHGHLRAPREARMESGASLGGWIVKQRERRKRGDLSREQIAELESLGMEWALDLPRERWEEGIRQARAFREEHGHLRAPKGYVTQDGYPLGTWISTQRTKHRKGLLNPEHVAALEELGMTWNPDEARWEERYAAARAYYARHGHLRVPHDYVTEDGVRLGSWILHQRQLRSGVKKGGLSARKIEDLDAIGMVWGNAQRSGS